MTINDRLEAAEGRPSGFNYLRLGLALSVILIHVPQTVYGFAFAYQFWMPYLRPAHALVIPLFFALSGFLVAGSLLRSKTLIGFFGLRIIRIAPALSVEVFLSALILGPIFTNLPVGKYYSDPLFIRYFYNLIGHVQFSLPGVFLDNPFANQVNAQLWTIPPELKCYILLGAMSLLLSMFGRSYFLAGAVAFSIAIFCYDLFQPLTNAINVAPILLVGCFLAGVSMFLFREKIICDGRLFVAAATASSVLLWVPHGEYLIAFPCAYVICYLGTLNPRENRLLFGGDYSYGIYLYGFPIQQAVIATLPGWPWYIDLAATLPLIGCVAYFSWWVVEKPALQLRKLLPPIERLMSSNLKVQASREL